MKQIIHYAKYPISEELHKKVNDIFETIKENPEGKEKREAVYQIVFELTNEGLDYFFSHSLRIIGMNILAQKAISAGMNTVKKTVKLLSKRFIRKFNDKQLFATIEFIEAFVNDRPMEFEK